MKNLLQRQYEMEERFLSPYATKSKESKGREIQENDDGLRTCFQRDRDRILHCKAFRRLKHKTQVFLSPEGDHYRTRLTHTLEVAQIARTIARALSLNEDLAEAISLGHDLGHTPYGHAGERVLDKFTDFTHNAQSLRMVDVLEKDGSGMNLSFEVRDGILNHTSRGNPSTLEGHVVAWSDRIAYINHDIDDALRGGVLKEKDIPKQYIKIFGDTHAKRINSMILDIVNYSFEKNHAEPSEEFKKHIGGLRDFMFEKVYTSSAAKEEEQKAMDLIEYLYNYYLKNHSKIPKNIMQLDATIEQKICDTISMMSDQYAARVFAEIAVPKNWDKL